MIPVATGNVVWGVTPLVLSCFLTEKQPPLELIVSVRAVLTRPNGDVFVFDDNGPHVLPGGRREGPEPLLDTLIREIGEEVGCSIDGPPRPLGGADPMSATRCGHARGALENPRQFLTRGRRQRTQRERGRERAEERPG